MTTKPILKDILEALLMQANGALSLEQFQSAFEENIPSKQELLNALDSLSQDYENRAIELKLLASGYYLQTKARYSPWINRLNIEKPVKYSRALLETLAIIAYQQPLTRAEIEAIRGVSVSSSLFKTLIEREWIKIASYRDTPGKPALYITTKNFLDYFNLSTLNELPVLTSRDLKGALPKEPSLSECKNEY